MLRRGIRLLDLQTFRAVGVRFFRVAVDAQNSHAGLERSRLDVINLQLAGRAALLAEGLNLPHLPAELGPPAAVMTAPRVARRLSRLQTRRAELRARCRPGGELVAVEAGGAYGHIVTVAVGAEQSREVRGTGRGRWSGQRRRGRYAESLQHRELTRRRRIDAPPREVPLGDPVDAWLRLEVKRPHPFLRVLHLP